MLIVIASISIFVCKAFADECERRNVINYYHKTKRRCFTREIFDIKAIPEMMKNLEIGAAVIPLYTRKKNQDRIIIVNAVNDQKLKVIFR